VREQVKWRSRGPIGKFHNIIVHIRATPQRREAFQRSVDYIISEMRSRGESPDFTSAMTVILDVETR